MSGTLYEEFLHGSVGKKLKEGTVYFLNLRDIATLRTRSCKHSVLYHF